MWQWILRNLAIRSLRSYLEIFHPLNQFINDTFVLRAIFYRLTAQEQARLVKKKRKYDEKRHQEAMSNGEVPPGPTSYTFYILQVWNKEHIASVQIVFKEDRSRRLLR